MNIRRRASVVCIHNGNLLTVKLKDPLSGVVHSYLPGGKMETDELPPNAAKRETLEETGYDIDVDLQSEVIADYLFPWAGEEVFCTTYFYLGALGRSSKPVQPPSACSYQLGVEWLSLNPSFSPECLKPLVLLKTA